MYEDAYYSSAGSVSATKVQDLHADSPALIIDTELHYPGAEGEHTALLSIISSRIGKFNSLELDAHLDSVFQLHRKHTVFITKTKQFPAKLYRDVFLSSWFRAS